MTTRTWPENGLRGRRALGSAVIAAPAHNISAIMN